MKISTSMLSVTNDLQKRMEELNQSTTDYFHLDVMDGKFVSNTTVTQMDQFLNWNQKPLDIHLMVEDIELFINKYRVLEPQFITFHVELQKDIEKYLKMVRSFGIKVGLAINPDTDLSALKPLLKEVDLILLMSVYPGKGGQSFITETTKRINTLKAWREQLQLPFLIEVDGGININTIQDVKEADIIVSGSYITNGNVEENIQNLKKLL